MFYLFCLASLFLGLFVCILAGHRRPWLVQAAYASTVVGSILTAWKIVPVFGDMYVSVAIGLYAMSFLFTDFLGEIHGRQTAIKSVYMGLCSALIVVFAIQFSIAVEPAPFWPHQDEYSLIHSRTLRILVASILAFGAAQFVDVHVFHWFKQKTNGRYLALRNNASTFAGQTIDSAIFFTIGFWGEVPNLLELVIVSCLFKFAVALLDTPVLYIARHWANRPAPTVSAPAGLDS